MIKKVISIVSVFILMVACSSSEVNPEKPKAVDNFDRQSMLINWADNIIIPVYEDLNSKLEGLVVAKNTFITTPDLSQLEAFRAAWLDAYMVWQYAEMFNVGTAETLNYGFQMNIYPTSTADIETNVSNGTYDLASVNNQDAVGFPALDYLLFGVAPDDSAIVEVYTTNTMAANYKAYLSDVVDRMKVLTDEVLNDWKSGYRDTFVNSAANTATSSTNKVVNDYLFYYEKGLRANKFGIPSGVFSTTILPEKVEAYYNQETSKVLALEALKAVQDFFNGKSYLSTMEENSLSSYLDYLSSINGGENLSPLINNQFNTARTVIQELNNNFYEQLNADPSKMTLAFDELQKAVVLLKVDMIQAMSISVDYIDADGD